MTTGADRLTHALTLFDRAVRDVPDGRWDAPSPCADWTAAAVVGHVIGGLAMIRTMVATGRRPEPPSGDPAVLAGDRPAETWETARSDLLATLAAADPDGTISTPGGDLPIDVGLGQASLELLVHGWDLATAVGHPFAIPDALAEPLLAELEPLDAALRPTGMYGVRVPVAADATPQERLLAFLGRTPTLERA
ncbi:TIGR03086 family metal-binding protein [Cryptosporangium aurantiacum]|uniref:TIGR03086 family protein n=1 Tax=Cryptosporangium aurantiacum TaxID=134849 RepID=A0A1M7RN31_9ACTN|nr:TIGR03086 family metal-binding protein [Cryptosporangium aurantiacum]SHN47747.1 TIGR03086 family protein [Cryptosporangium aurantiacum]